MRKLYERIRDKLVKKKVKSIFIQNLEVNGLLTLSTVSGVRKALTRKADMVVRLYYISFKQAL